MDVVKLPEITYQRIIYDIGIALGSVLFLLTRLYKIGPRV